MQVFSSPEQLSQYLLTLQNQGKTIGLVPTMGALHDGHGSLIGASKEKDDITVVSIFVNRLQFNNKEDFENYPRPFPQDKEKLEQLGVDFLFAPSEKEMYPNPPEVTVDFGRMGEVMEGQFRPGHFNGVGIVVAKLFNIIWPTRAYFGLKDMQQYLLIRKMTKDLSMQVDVVGLPIIREESGLAMSSRNMRLSASGKEHARIIYQGLLRAEVDLANRMSVDETKMNLFAFYRQSGLEVEYAEFVNPENLESMHTWDEDMVICIAAYVEEIRLIDNLYLRHY